MKKFGQVFKESSTIQQRKKLLNLLVSKVTIDKSRSIDTIELQINEDVIRYFKGKKPILGVCLGHQAICEVFGAEITHAKKLMHGKKSTLNIDPTCKIFNGMGDKMVGARYHSLIAKKETLPQELIVTSTDDMGEIMAVKHRDYEIYGLQFHPESILTVDGKKLLENFLDIK